MTFFGLSRTVWQRENQVSLNLNLPDGINQVLSADASEISAP